MPLVQIQEAIDGVKIAGLVHQVNWLAVQAQSITPTGEIQFTGIYVLGGPTYTTIPVTLPLNSEVKGGVLIRNTCSVTLMMQLLIWFTDPAGQVRGYYEQGAPSAYAPGESSPVATRYAILDKPGNWMLRAELYAEVA